VGWDKGLFVSWRKGRGHYIWLGGNPMCGVEVEFRSRIQKALLSQVDFSSNKLLFFYNT